MKVNERLKWGSAFLLASLILRPWRESVSQDDAIYASTAIRFGIDHLTIHPGQLASAWPQMILGALGLKLNFFTGQIAILNFLTWICFGLLVGVTQWVSAIPALVVASFFSFPTWVQYGASYLTDIYAGLFLVLILVGFKAKRLSAAIPTLLLAPICLVLQRQTMVAFPLAWAVAVGISNSGERRRRGLVLGLGVVLGLGIYRLLPHSLIQNALVYWRMKEWAHVGVAEVLEMCVRYVQLALSVGVFLLPFARVDSVRRVGMGAALQAMVFMALYFLPTPLFSAGIFFLDYLPKWVGVLFFSSGIWGLSCLRDVKEFCGISARSTLFAGSAVAAFYIFQKANDFRYSMLIALPLLFHFGDLDSRWVLGRSKAYLCAVAGLGLFLVQYNLNSTDARWKLAGQLVNQGADIREISAGYGHDLFYLVDACVDGALKKLRKKYGEDYLGTQEFYDSFLGVARIYEYGWKSRYIIKPSVVLGLPIKISGVEESGPGSAQSQDYSYSVFGLSCKLKMIERKSSELAYCFRE